MVTVMLWFAEVVANVSHAPMFSSYSLISCDMACASPSTEIMSDTRIPYFWPLSAGEAAGVTVIDVALFTDEIWNIWTGLDMTIIVWPARTWLAGAVQFVPVPVAVFPLIAIVPVL